VAETGEIHTRRKTCRYVPAQVDVEIAAEHRRKGGLIDAVLRWNMAQRSSEQRLEAGFNAPGSKQPDLRTRHEAVLVNRDIGSTGNGCRRAARGQAGIDRRVVTRDIGGYAKTTLQVLRERSIPAAHVGLIGFGLRAHSGEGAAAEDFGGLRGQL